MIEQLFGSKTRVKLLNLFYSSPNRSYYVREITRTIDEQINSVRRELANLLKIGLIKSENSNNKLFYEVDQNYEYYKELFAIFSSLSDEEEGATVVEDQYKKYKELGSVKIAYLTGIFVRDDSMPVDLFVVGDVNQNKMNALVAELEEEKGKEINYTVLSEKDFTYRLQLNDRFVNRVMDSKKVVVIDTINKG